MIYRVVTFVIILLTACAALLTAALNAGKIQFDKFNVLVSKANLHGYAAALEELQGIV